MLRWATHPLFIQGFHAVYLEYSYLVLPDDVVRGRWTSSFQNQVTGGSASNTIMYHDTLIDAKDRCQRHADGERGS